MTSTDSVANPKISSLFQPLQVGAVKLRNRLVMAPLTRGRAGKERIPNELMQKYYTQRASAGLIISEATQISEEGAGWSQSPGIHTEEQVKGWQKITEAVHQQGGLIYLQLWHTGRASHPYFQPNGQLPVSASAIKTVSYPYLHQRLKQKEMHIQKKVKNLTLLLVLWNCQKFLE